MSDLHDLSVAELAAKLLAREVSAVETARHFLARGAAEAQLGRLSGGRRRGDAGPGPGGRCAARRRATQAPLLGVPIAHKDIFVTKDFASTAGSKMLQDYRSPFDATVVSRLAAAGAVTLGKLNCDEFAMGSSNENSAYQPVRNPWDRVAHSGRLLRRQRRGGGGPAGTRRDRHRHRRLDPPAGLLLRRHRHQADLWPRLALRHDRLRLQPGPGRADGAQRAGLRAAAVGHVRPRSRPRLDLARRAGRGLHPLAGRFRRRACASAFRDEFFGEGLAADVRAAIDGALKEYQKLGAKLVEPFRCRAPSCRFRSTTSLRRPRLRPTSRASTASSSAIAPGNTATWSTCTRRPAPKASATRSSAAS